MRTKNCDFVPDLRFVHLHLRGEREVALSSTFGRQCSGPRSFAGQRQGNARPNKSDGCVQRAFFANFSDRTQSQALERERELERKLALEREAGKA